MKNLGSSRIRCGFCVLFFFTTILTFTSHATGSTGTLTVSPSNINFLNVLVGSSQTQSVTLANPGGPKVTVTQATLSGTGFTMRGPSYPLTLSGGQSVTCTITFAPQAAGTDSGSVSITFTTQTSSGKGNNGPTTTRTVNLSGTALTASGSTVSVTVSPSTASLQPSQQAQFTATVSGTSNTGVTWSASAGALTSGGLYTAPSSAGSYTITATSMADSSKSASAVVTVTQPISISVSPTTANLQTSAQQQFTAFVSGTSNTGVNWTASGGSISAAGLYTAPTLAGTYAVSAVSAADATKSSSATISVFSPQVVSVSVSPGSVSMPEKWQQQFAATISGTSNTGVTWAVTQGSGTITQTGLYTAPQAAETDLVRVTSQADNTKSASATINIVPPHSVSLTWMPSSSSGISCYNVYRGTTTGGPYSLLKNGVSSTSYTDSNVQSGSTYYYVTTALNTSGMESAYSGEASAVIPMP